MTTENSSFTAFSGTTRVATGTPQAIAQVLQTQLDREALQSVLVFDDLTGRPRDIDLREGVPTLVDAPQASANDAPKRRGRPKLGVVAKEVTLLPRHWEWLAAQPGGASVTLRKLVDNARRGGAKNDNQREALEACYRVMQALAGDLPGYEEALRALYAGDRDGFEQGLRGWPEDVASYISRFASVPFERA